MDQQVSPSVYPFSPSVTVCPCVDRDCVCVWSHQIGASYWRSQNVCQYLGSHDCSCVSCAVDFSQNCCYCPAAELSGPQLVLFLWGHLSGVFYHLFSPAHYLNPHLEWSISHSMHGWQQKRNISENMLTFWTTAAVACFVLWVFVLPSLLSPPLSATRFFIRVWTSLVVSRLSLQLLPSFLVFV